MKTINIVIKDIGGDTIFETTNKTYKHDLEASKNNLFAYWKCNVEYYNAVRTPYDIPLVRDGKKPRRIILYNGKSIYADYCFILDGKQNIYEMLKTAFKEDFK